VSGLVVLPCRPAPRTSASGPGRRWTVSDADGYPGAPDATRTPGGNLPADSAW